MQEKVLKCPKKICNYGGCHAIIAGNKKYCEEHMKLCEQLRADNNRRYDTKIRYKRDKQYASFYHSKEWVRLRDYIIKHYKGLDLFAYFIENKIVSASTGHHIVELKEDWNLRLVIDNIIPVSDVSHNKIHAMYNKNKKRTQELLKEIISKCKF